MCRSVSTTLAAFEGCTLCIRLSEYMYHMASALAFNDPSSHHSHALCPLPGVPPHVHPMPPDQHGTGVRVVLEGLHQMVLRGGRIVVKEVYCKPNCKTVANSVNHKGRETLP